MPDVTNAHEEKETLAVDVIIPGHAPRAATPTFERTRRQLLARDGARCFISGEGAAEAGQPLEAHHYPLERCMAGLVDWQRVRADALAGEFGASKAQRAAAQAFDWDGFLAAQPFDPYAFIDNMLVNGMLLAKRFHTGKDEGIHMLPHPLWVIQRYALEGTKFSEVETIHHAEMAGGGHV